MVVFFLLSPDLHAVDSVLTRIKNPQSTTYRTQIKKAITSMMLNLVHPYLRAQFKLFWTEWDVVA